MWLINTTTLKLEFFIDLNNAPRPYAILSHTWEEDEVSFQEFQELATAAFKKGFKKIEMTCKLARARGIEYAWVDTCCIDKTNNVELTEAINSMFLWYKESDVCFAYLSDLRFRRHTDYLGSCRWFGRGWTLQELIAPREVEFLDSEWSVIGQKRSMVEEISRITGIDQDVLLDSVALEDIAVARKMSWAATRTTTRIEDMAYCLIGIFGVNMTMIYGEGCKAFYRLQEEIVKETNDLSLFAWRSLPLSLAASQEYRGIFAQTVCEFKGCRNISLMPATNRFDQEFAITNKGLRLETILAVENYTFVLNLQCYDMIIQTPNSVEWLGIYLTQTPRGFVRSRPSEMYVASRTEWHFGNLTRIYVPKTLTVADCGRINDQYHTVIALSDFEAGPFKVMTARPESLWDSSKGFFFIGRENRFTGYLHMRCISKDCPEFEFIIICGRSHRLFGYWCVVFSPSSDRWATILEATKMASRIADVPSSDHIIRSLQESPKAVSLSTQSDCEIHVPYAKLRERISVEMRRGTCKELIPSLARIDGDCHRIDITCTFPTLSVEAYKEFSS